MGLSIWYSICMSDLQEITKEDLSQVGTIMFLVGCMCGIAVYAVLDYFTESKDE
jgi:hypothetical protein